MSIKRMKISFLGVMLIALSVGAIHYYQGGDSNFNKPKVITLSELKKDIVRDAVPVTGKIRDLHPPKRGEPHPHAH